MVVNMSINNYKLIWKIKEFRKTIFDEQICHLSKSAWLKKRKNNNNNINSLCVTAVILASILLNTKYD